MIHSCKKMYAAMKTYIFKLVRNRSEERSVIYIIISHCQTVNTPVCTFTIKDSGDEGIV